MSGNIGGFSSALPPTGQVTSTSFVTRFLEHWILVDTLAHRVTIAHGKWSTF
ncbi:hypothetical protein PAXRUDRAFT_832655 [Paxillus rubicundulus Ve08.2h10]|uniref:Uncharacterized protein n=1 Tax=Paxillus rubicundulus Ve08.2h10 TaxID=930991 RepID=A0A0D0DC45_9AGAM|nr:hypothetical protein PAXRUDRAFT_832655 [Paxillus rubicundulus Ve08.2h10]